MHFYMQLNIGFVSMPVGIHAFLRAIEHRVCQHVLGVSKYFKDVSKMCQKHGNVCFGLSWAAVGCSGLLWAALTCCGLLWAALGWAVLRCSGLFWAALGCSGLLWAVLGCFGLFWAVLGCSGLFWAVLGCSGLSCARACMWIAGNVCIFICN